MSPASKLGYKTVLSSQAIASCHAFIVIPYEGWKMSAYGRTISEEGRNRANYDIFKQLEM